MSNSCRVFKILVVAGLRALANSKAPSCCGISVPTIDVIAIIISKARVSFTDLKMFHNGFDLFSVIVFSDNIVDLDSIAESSQ